MDNSLSTTICVIGKSSILYDEPEKAVEVENGQTLITWFGDSSLLIDRLVAK